MSLQDEEYYTLYQQSIVNSDDFWATQAKKFITWFKPWSQIQRGDFNTLDIEWFINAELNASYNCVDRHLIRCADLTAILWQGDDREEVRKLTYAQLFKEVCRTSNVLKKFGVQKGDTVCLYLPMIPEIIITMLACARIGAVHSVVFSAFSKDALKIRIQDANCKLVITADEGVRGGKVNPLKSTIDAALEECECVKTVLVVKRTGNQIPWRPSRDHWYHEEVLQASEICSPENMNSKDPLFILYTSGSTGKPKGIVHATAGYLVYVAMTFQYLFNYKAGDVHWCTADIGWITGHSYLVYGPLLDGATTLLFEGVPNFPTFSRYWEIIDAHQVNTFYTAPTAIRTLRKQGDQWVKKTDRKSLKLLGSVGEPINPEAWHWYYEVVGNKRCPIIDTWWQTETGGIMLSPYPTLDRIKPGAASLPFFGIIPAILDEKGRELPQNTKGKLVITKPWPGLMKTIHNDPARFKNYFNEFPGYYVTGDSAYYDEEGDYWIIGREDDVIKVSGHRIGTGELESVLVSHPSIAEAAVVAISHEVKGSAIVAFVTPKASIQPSDDTKAELIKKVREEIGPFAAPEKIQWAKELPKTRSAKIMRRILKKIANNEKDLGDLSTLADPGCIEDLISQR